MWKKGENTTYCFIIKEGKFEMKAPYKKVPKEFYLTIGCLVGDFPNLLDKEETKSEVKCLEDGIIFVLDAFHLNEFLK